MFSCISLVLKISLPFTTLVLFEEDWLVISSDDTWFLLICPIFPIIMHFWWELRRSGVNSVHCTRRHWCQFVSLVIVTLVSWLRWCLPCFFLVKLQFSPLINNYLLEKFFWNYINFSFCTQVLEAWWFLPEILISLAYVKC